MSWGEKNMAPPFRLSADTMGDLGDQVRASRLAQPENTDLVTQAAFHMEALKLAVSGKGRRDAVQREALACMCWLGRLIEEGDAP